MRQQPLKHPLMGRYLQSGAVEACSICSRKALQQQAVTAEGALPAALPWCACHPTELQVSSGGCVHTKTGGALPTSANLQDFLISSVSKEGSAFSDILILQMGLNALCQDERNDSE